MGFKDGFKITFLNQQQGLFFFLMNSPWQCKKVNKTKLVSRNSGLYNLQTQIESNRIIQNSIVNRVEHNSVPIDKLSKSDNVRFFRFNYSVDDVQTIINFGFNRCFRLVVEVEFFIPNRSKNRLYIFIFENFFFKLITKFN